MSLNFARQVALIAAASAFVTSIAVAQGATAYAPGKLHYHVTTVSTRSQPLGGGRAPFDFSTTTNQWISLEVAPQSADTLKVAMTVDSIHITSTLDAPPPDIAVLQGSKYTGTMSPRGRIYSLAPVTNSTDGKLGATATALRPVRPAPRTLVRPRISRRSRSTSASDGPAGSGMKTDSSDGSTTSASKAT